MSNPDQCSHKMILDEGQYICTLCGLASREQILESSLPYVEGVDASDISARIQSSHYVIASSDDAQIDLCSEEETLINQRIINSFKRFSEHFSEKLSAHISTYPKAHIDYGYDVWKVFYRDQEKTIKYRKHTKFYDALGYIIAVHAKDVHLMSKYTTHKIKRELRLLKFAVQPYEIIQIYLDDWIPRFRSKNLVINVHRSDNISKYEPRDYAAGLLWKFIAPLSMLKDGIRCTQAEMTEMTNSKASTFVVISQRI